MKKYYAVVLLAIFALPVAAQEKVKIGFIDIQKAITTSEAGKRAKEKFAAQLKKAEEDLLKEKQGVERMKSDLEKKGLLLKEEERRNLEREFQRRYMGYQRSTRDFQEELRQREGEMTAEILKDLEGIVTGIGKKEKFTLILERSQFLYSDQGIDITDKVIELYNGRYQGRPGGKGSETK